MLQQILKQEANRKTFDFDSFVMYLHASNTQTAIAATQSSFKKNVSSCNNCCNDYFQIDFEQQQTTEMHNFLCHFEGLKLEQAHLSQHKQQDFKTIQMLNFVSIVDNSKTIFFITVSNIIHEKKPKTKTSLDSF